MCVDVDLTFLLYNPACLKKRREHRHIKIVPIGSRLNLAIQTILWGPYVRDPEALLTQIRQMGFTGVEIAQHPNALLRAGLNSESLGRLLNKLGMTLLSFTEGSIEDRLHYCRPHLKPSYYYVEHVSASDINQLGGAAHLALHAHVFKKTARLDDAIRVLKAYPEVKWIPDTAHQFIAGDSPIEAIRLVPWSRMPAVHVKDWTSVHSRSAHRYPRGFCDLGTGEVPVDKVLAELIAKDYQGFVVIEQDYPPTSVTASLDNTFTYLHQFGANLQKTATLESRYYPGIVIDPDSPSANIQARISRHWALPAGLNLKRFYDFMSGELASIFSANKVVIWSVNPTQPLLTLIGQYPTGNVKTNCTIARSSALSPIALDKFEPCVFDLTSSEPGNAFGRPEAILGLPELVDVIDTTLIAIPAFSPYNHNHERLLISIISSCAPPPSLLEIASGIAETIVLGADEVLDRMCMWIANGAQAAVAESGTLSAFASKLCAFIKASTNCEAVSLFAEDFTDNTLRHLHTTSELIWRVAPENQYYTPGEGLTGRAWQRAEPINTAHIEALRGRLGKSSERVTVASDAGLLLPLTITPSKAIGVVRCKNKLGDDGRVMAFNDDDTAIIEAAANAVSPSLQLLLQQQRSNESLICLTHELLSPLEVVNGASLRIERDIRAAGLSNTSVFKKDYLGDLRNYIDLFFRLVGNVELFGLEKLRPKFDGGPHFLLSEVVAPTVSQLTYQLRERNLRDPQISYEGFEDIPRLWIDKSYLQQTFFNLLTNARKYCFSDKTALNIIIRAKKTFDGFQICVSDYGIGVERGFEEAIFSRHIRAPGAPEKDSKGQGLGLWIVRRIVEAHGGRIRLTSNHMPTTFEIVLPFSLEKSPPSIDWN